MAPLLRLLARPRVRHVAALAVAIAALVFWLSASCGTQHDPEVDVALDAIEDAAASARAALEEEEVDSADLRDSTRDMVEGLYVVERCAKEGHLRSSVYLSERVGRLDSIIDARRAGEDAKLRAEAGAVLGDIERLVGEARAEAATHPRPLRCR